MEIIEHKTLNEAFVYAQMEFEAIVHNHTVDFLTKEGRRVNYTYADLVQCQKALYPALNKHGLGISYEIEDADGAVYLVIEMCHAFSDTCKKARLRMEGAVEAKDLAAEITYLKRYLLGLITGTGSEEDNDADRLPERKQTPQPDKSQERQQKAAGGASGTAEPHKETALTISVRELAKECGYPDLKEYLGHSSKNMDTKQWSTLKITFKTYKAAAVWFANEITRDFSEVIDFAVSYPGGWRPLMSAIKAVKDGGSIDNLWSEFTSWGKSQKTDSDRDINEARKTYIDMIAGKFGEPTDPVLRKTWEREVVPDREYANWTLPDLLKGIEMRKAADASDAAFEEL